MAHRSRTPDGEAAAKDATSKAELAGVPESFPRIWRAIAAIPSGTVTSYGRVAAHAGLPRRARLVAQALRAAPDDLQLPWHRVVRADGRIAFPRGSAAFRQQRRLLQGEGVTVPVDGRIRTVDDSNDLDAVLWRP